MHSEEIVETCKASLPKANIKFTSNSVCRIHPGTDYKGGDLGHHRASTKESLDACCHACRNIPECKHFTFVPSNLSPGSSDGSSGLCFLKHNQGTVIPDPNRLDGIVSGDIL